MEEVTVSVPINIAIVKYWGKRDETLMLPLNDSLSLSIDALRASTTVRTRRGPDSQDTVAINGREIPRGDSERFERVFAEARRCAARNNALRMDDESNALKFEVISTTNFPIEAGLASSAAGFAALAIALGHLCDLNDEDVQRIARLGSGSACRSVLDGFVHWRAGSSRDGCDCICSRVAPISDWPDLRAVVVVTSSRAKCASSARGMQASVATSSLLSYRCAHVVPGRIQRLRAAIEERDFARFAEITMAESNQLHAICMDTSPPLRYLSAASWQLMRLVEALNARVGSAIAAYTFDAGPNCCIFVEERNLFTLLACLGRYSSPVTDADGCMNIFRHLDASLRAAIHDAMQCDRTDLTGFVDNEHSINAIEYVMCSTVGGGPMILASRKEG